MRERAGFLSPNRISELGWDSENKELWDQATASVISVTEFYAFLDSR
jgi:hypothetical protein